MRVTFDHNFGHQEQGSFIHFNCSLEDVHKSEYNDALDQGFLLTVEHGQKYWYQSRSTRVATANTNFDLISSAHILEHNIPWTEMDHIYTAYCYYKKFKKYFEINEHLSQDKFMAYYANNNFVAWSKLRQYSSESIETCLFVWDYANPELQLGITSLHHEIAWAKNQGFSYVYLGPGYERSSVYKSRLPGFEWWTGAQWSQDVDKYEWLCQRDSKIKLTANLYQL